MEYFIKKGPTVLKSVDLDQNNALHLSAHFGSLTGTPIINQPQVGIVAVGVIQKKPAVIETSQGDSIAIRKKMIISHSYDHRIINGAIGGQFIKSISDYLENWNKDLPI